LITKGANINAKDVYNVTPLLKATYHGHTDIVKMLVENGADVNAKNPERREPVLYAALAAGFADIVELLGGDTEELANADRGPYSVIVTDPKAVQKFLLFAGIDFDQVWIPEKTDIKDIESILRAYLEKNASIEKDTCLKNILLNYRWYNREYSGFINDGTNYIICNMHLFDEVFLSNPLNNKFRLLFDIGGSVARIIFDPKSKAIVRINCY